MADSFQPDSFTATSSGDSFVPDKPTYTRGFVKTYKGKPQGFLQKADVAAGDTASFLLNLFNSPYDAVGEAITAPIEQRKPRLPDVFYRGQPDATTQPPAANPLSTVNKLLRAGAGAVSGIPGGQPLQAAQSAYSADRGAMGPVEDTALAALLGKLAPEVLSAPADATLIGAKKALQGAGKLGKAALAVATNVSQEDIATRFADPKAIQNAPTVEQLALKDVPGTANKFKETISSLQQKAKDTLSTSRYLEPTALPDSVDQGGAFTKEQVIGEIEKARKNLGGIYTDQGKAAAGTLDNLAEDLNKIRNTVSQNQVHDYIVKLDQEIPWTKVWKAPDTLTMEDHALIDVRTNLDGILKDKNPDYAKAMGPLSDAISTRNDFLKKFSLERVKGGGFQPSDTTVTKVSNALKENKLGTQRVLSKTQAITGEDLLQKIKDAKTAEAFQPGGVSGVRTAESGIVGALLSALMGHSPYAGGAAGSGLAAVSDYYGGPAAANVIDLLSKGKTGVGNILSAVNSKTEGTPIQELLKRILAGQPAMAPLLRGG